MLLRGIAAVNFVNNNDRTIVHNTTHVGTCKIWLPHFCTFVRSLVRYFKISVQVLVFQPIFKLKATSSNGPISCFFVFHASRTVVAIYHYSSTLQAAPTISGPPVRKHSLFTVFSSSAFAIVNRWTRPFARYLSSKCKLFLDVWLTFHVTTATTNMIQWHQRPLPIEINPLSWQKE